MASPPMSDLNVTRRRFALSSRLTHAMNREGSVGSLSVTFVGVDVPGVWDSHLGWPEMKRCRWLCWLRLESTPDVIATPMVPHPVR